MALRQGLDRRRPGHGRIVFEIPATLHLAGLINPAPLALTKNLCRGGVRVQLVEPTDPGAEVTISLHLFDHPPLVRAGRIAWVQRQPGPLGPWFAGIAFHNELAPAAVAQLASESSPA